MAGFDAEKRGSRPGGVCLALLLGCALLTLNGCGGAAAPEETQEPAETAPAAAAAAPTPTAVPTSAPTPSPAPTEAPERTLSAYGVEFSSFVRELDLSGVPVEDGGAELERLIPDMPYLEKVIMSDCGVPDEEMDALNRRWEGVRFVWTIYFGRFYYLRTDETAFIASLFQGNQSYYTNLSNEEIMKLRYCTDMVALDVGHMDFTTCEFVRDMKHLRYFIISDTRVEDLSPLADHGELWFLELFGSKVTDVSPLLSCPNLRHLNVSWCDIRDPEDLYEMTYLERLWYMSPWLTREVYDGLRERLTGTELQLGMGGSSVGGTWRLHPAYYEMRDAFGAFYIPPP